MFSFQQKSTRGHCYKLCKQTNHTNTRFSFFGQRIINVWNSLPDCVDFRSLSSFKRTILLVNFNQFLKVYKFSREQSDM